MMRGLEARRILRFGRRFFDHAPLPVIGHVVMTLVLGALQGISIVMLVPLLGELGVPGVPTGSAFTAITAFVFDTMRIPRSLAAILGLYLLLVIARAILERYRVLADARLQLDFVRALRLELHETLLHADWAFLAAARRSDFAQVLTTDVQRAGQAALLSLNFITGAVMLLVYVIIALGVSVIATVSALIVAGALAWLLRGAAKTARDAGDDLTAHSNRLYAVISEHLGGLAEIRSYGAESWMQRSFAHTTESLDRTRFDFAISQSAVRLWMTIGAAAALSALVFAAVAGLQLSAAALLLLIYLFARLVPQATQLQSTALQFIHALPGFDEVQRLLCAARSAAASPEPEPVPPLEHGIRFDGVGYMHRRPNGGVSDLSFCIPARTMTAIVGESGSGKSTVAMILMGFLMPGTGRVLIDGVPLTPAMHRAWRKRIGFVPQDTFLLHDTIAANLRLARPGAAEDELWAALTLADAADFVRALPQGLDTMVGDRGTQLSGGERQRVALARALLVPPDILILDEATSAIDVESERRIYDAIERLHGRLTVVVITHRDAVAARMDHVIVLDRGRMVKTKGVFDVRV